MNSCHLVCSKSSLFVLIDKMFYTDRFMSNIHKITQFTGKKQSIFMQVLFTDKWIRQGRVLEISKNCHDCVEKMIKVTVITKKQW